MKPRPLPPPPPTVSVSESESVPKPKTPSKGSVSEKTIEESGETNAIIESVLDVYNKVLE